MNINSVAGNNMEALKKADVKPVQEKKPEQSQETAAIKRGYDTFEYSSENARKLERQIAEGIKSNPGQSAVMHGNAEGLLNIEA